MLRFFSAVRLLTVLIVAVALVGASAVGLVAASSSDTSPEAVAFQQSNATGGNQTSTDTDTGTSGNQTTTDTDTSTSGNQTTTDADTATGGNETGGGQSGAASTDGRPAHIHNGTCEELDPNPEYPLNGVVPDDDSDDDSVEVSETEVQVTLDELLAEPHAINIHASAEDAGTYVACGNIVGEPIDLDGDDDDDAQLTVGLREQNDSGLVGVAIIDDDDDDGETDVHVYLTSVDDGTSADSTPDATG